MGFTRFFWVPLGFILPGLVVCEGESNARELTEFLPSFFFQSFTSFFLCWLRLRVP